MPPDLGRLRVLLDTLGWPYMIIGGIAVAARGRPRMTGDADVTVAVPEGAEPLLIDRCRAAGFRPLPDEPLAFVVSHHVLPLVGDDGTRVDLVVAGSPYESDAIARATDVNMEGVVLRVATAEDVVIHKVVAGRPTDLEDARSVVRRSGPQFDAALVRSVVLPLADALQDDDLRRRLEEILGG